MDKKKPEPQTAATAFHEQMLSALFDYQKFENEPSLMALIDETERLYGAEIPDDELFDVSAAGETVPVKKFKKPEDDSL